MRILVTGAAGFLGRALLRTIASRAPDDEITALDVTANSSEAAAHGQISWLSGAVDDREVMEKAGLQDFDIIYHLVNVPGALAEREPALGRRINLDATLDLFDRLAASGRRPRVIYASSDSRSAPTVRPGQRARTAPTSGWRRWPSQTIHGGAGFPELRCAFQASSRDTEKRPASARPS